MSGYSTDTAEVKALRKRVEELEREVDETGTESLIAGYEQCLQDMRKIVDGVLETTWAQGPAEGLMLVLKRLEQKDVEVTTSLRRVPYDWLSRWEVKAS